MVRAPPVGDESCRPTAASHRNVLCVNTAVDAALVSVHTSINRRLTSSGVGSRYLPASRVLRPSAQPLTWARTSLPERHYSAPYSTTAPAGNPYLVWLDSIVYRHSHEPVRLLLPLDPNGTAASTDDSSRSANSAAWLCFNSTLAIHSNTPARRISSSLIHLLPTRPPRSSFKGTLIELQHCCIRMCCSSFGEITAAW